MDVLLPPPKKEVMFLVRSVCLSVCLSVCPSDYSQTCERIWTKFFVLYVSDIQQLLIFKKYDCYLELE